MTSFSIFFHRLKTNWRFTYKNFRMVADWTVIVYLIIPAIVIGGFIYRSWWIKGIPEWSMYVPLQIFFLLGYIVSWGGNYQTFIEDGDRVFLVKHRSLFYRLKIWGFVYSLFFQLIVTGGFLVFLLPFFFHHGLLQFSFIASFIIYIISMKYFLMHLKYELRKINNKWIRSCILISLFIIFLGSSLFLSPLWLAGKAIVPILSIIIGLSSIFYHFKKLNHTYSFEHDLNLELEKKMRSVQFIMQMSPHGIKPKVIERKRPWLFRKSQLLFKKRNGETGILELFIKVFLRDGNYLRTVFQMASITGSAVVIVPPIWLKIVVFVSFLLMLSFWLDNTWQTIVLDHPFTKKYVDNDSYYLAKSKGTRYLFYIALMLHIIIVSVGLWIYNSFVNIL